MLRSILIFILLIAVAGPLEAQDKAVVQDHLPVPGSKVRVTFSGARDSEIFTRGFVRGDSLLLLSGGSWIAVPLSAVEMLEARRRSALHGGAYGAVIGALGLGGIWGASLALSGSQCGGDECWTRGERGVLGFAFGAVLGLPTGALIGAAIGTDRWEPLHSNVQVGVAPSGGGSATLSIKVPLH